MKFTLCITKDCNLTCSYCYSGAKANEAMSFDTAKKIVDYAFKIIPEGEKLEFNFFGGEPLLYFDLIKQIVSYIRNKEKDSNTKTLLNITTNGTVFSKEIIEYLLAEKFHIAFSIDGPKHIHDKNRKFTEGKGSFDSAFENLMGAKDSLNDFQVNAVYGPDTLSGLPETFKFFIDNDISSIHLNPNVCTKWDDDIFEVFKDVYSEIADIYIDSYRKGNEIALNLIDNKVILFLKKGYEETDKCGKGELERAFTASGDVYHCERLSGNENNKKFCLGNIDKPDNIMSPCHIVKSEGPNLKCLECKFNKYCMNWCQCTNFYTSGHPNKVSEMMCACEQAAIMAAKKVYLTLYEENNELFVDHYMQYLKNAYNCGLFN